MEKGKRRKGRRGEGNWGKELFAIWTVKINRKSLFFLVQQREREPERVRSYYLYHPERTRDIIIDKKEDKTREKERNRQKGKERTRLKRQNKRETKGELKREEKEREEREGGKEGQR